MGMGNARRLVYLHSHPHFQSHHEPTPGPNGGMLAFTLSSQTGSGALVIAEGLAARLQAQTQAPPPGWRVFARSLIEKVLEEQRLPARLARFLPEDAHNTVDDVLDELFGLHPSSWEITQKTAHTILKLAQVGRVILVGWGAHVITRHLTNVFHVRLVGSLEQRLERIQQRERLDRKRALAFIQRQDRGRERYLDRYFSQQLSEPLLYHLTINTDRFSHEDTINLIAETALSRMHECQTRRQELVMRGSQAGAAD